MRAQVAALPPRSLRKDISGSISADTELTSTERKVTARLRLCARLLAVIGVSYLSVVRLKENRVVSTPMSAQQPRIALPRDRSETAERGTSSRDPELSNPTDTAAVVDARRGTCAKTDGGQPRSTAAARTRWRARERSLPIYAQSSMRQTRGPSGASEILTGNVNSFTIDRRPSINRHPNSLPQEREQRRTAAQHRSNSLSRRVLPADLDWRCLQSARLPPARS